MPMTMKKSGPPYGEQKKRWYDNDPVLRDEVYRFLSLPLEIQAIMAEVLISIANELYQTESMIKNVKSLGAVKVLSLYKSKNKRRSYDMTPITHKAMSHLSVLPDQGVKEITGTLREMNNAIEEVRQLFYSQGKEAPSEEIRAVLISYSQNGSHAASGYLEHLQEKMPSLISSGKLKPAKEPLPRLDDDSETKSGKSAEHSQESVDSGETGMRIRADLDSED